MTRLRGGMSAEEVSAAKTQLLEEAVAAFRLEVLVKYGKLTTEADTNVYTVGWIDGFEKASEEIAELMVNAIVGRS